MAEKWARAPAISFATSLCRTSRPAACVSYSCVYHPTRTATSSSTIGEIEGSGWWPGPVVTEINPEERFWQAEPEHQDYLQRHPGGYSCHFIRPSWRLPSAQAFQKSRTAEGPETDPPLAAMVSQGRGSLPG